MDMGDLEPAWTGFILYKNELWLPEGLHYTPQTLRAEWWNRQLIREMRRRLNEPQQYDLFHDWHLSV